eukprot:CAMPEP_0180180342 /NCGR_PEP_ID=MMETSP0986-20121125/39531_1 /TAXON_ID=697907 /ORGANISM="non described non described, Strain CCMP2293" /LENGTH=137 /DNA_ID=CAMNT_0022133537 /DNA_START=70 /DNA_END=480 /DNA_ORIENTATION=+
MSSDDRFHILALVHTGYELMVYKDGTVDPLVQDHNLESAEGVAPYVTPVRATALDGLLAPMDSVIIGAISLASNTSEFLEGDLAEALVLDTDLSVADIDSIASYLSRKYGLYWQATTGPRATAITPANGPAVGGYQI